MRQKNKQESIQVVPGTIVHIKCEGVPQPGKDFWKPVREFVKEHGGKLIISYGSDTEIKTIPEISILHKIYESLQRIEKKLK